LLLAGLTGAPHARVYDHAGSSEHSQFIAPLRFAFRIENCVGTRNDASFAARWLAYALPCQRFAEALAGDCATVGVDVVRYTFIVADFHLLLLAGVTGALSKWHEAAMLAWVARQSLTGDLTDSIKDQTLIGAASRTCSAALVEPHRIRDLQG